MATANISANRVSIPEMVSIEATELSPPPAWALIQRQLMSLMEEAAPMMVKKYSEPGGALLWADDLDDFYEAFYNWGLFYAMGADESLLDMALTAWNASTRISDESIVHRKHPRFKQSVHREYYSLANPGDAEWHHKGEGNMAFYDFGVACPTISENVRRAKQFAGWYIGEDPEAPNYDPTYKVLRSPAQTGEGPWHKTTLRKTMAYLHGGHPDMTPLDEYIPKPMGVRASLYPVFKELEPGWWNDSERADKILKLFEKVVLQSDSSNNLAATGLVTNAYLYTGDEKYKKWVLEYTEAWMDRTKQNNGILPDNVGPTGKIGEHRDGCWWGGLYGWNHYQGLNIMFHGLITAVECAVLLTGDFGYLDLLRSQINVLLDNAITRDDGQLLVPARYGPDGWESHQPMRLLEIAHLYHASMSAEDYDLFARIRAGDVERAWNQIESSGEKNVQLRDGHQNMAWFNYYDGKNPDWPEKILESEYQMALAAYEHIRGDERDVETLIAENAAPYNPVFTKGLTQVMLGAPQSVYNGGLLRATVRYFDRDRARPGLPKDVAALVDKLESDRAGVQLVNLSTTETRNVIVQAGAFGEHQFREVRYQAESQEGLAQNPYGWLRNRPAPTEKIVPVNAKYFAVQLPPSTTIRLDIGMQRFVNDPGYAFPWHGERIPVPFQ